ncbi:MAG: hypothetical protein ACQEUM_14495 [Pseudomonadota bacterium]
MMFPSRRCFRLAPVLLLLASGTALSHSGHGAPAVHAHTGSPSLLVVAAVVVLGVTALVPLARLVLRRRRLRRRR